MLINIYGSKIYIVSTVFEIIIIYFRWRFFWFFASYYFYLNGLSGYVLYLIRSEITENIKDIC